jgi:hypothetical protein
MEKPGKIKEALAMFLIGISITSLCMLIIIAIFNAI